MEIRDLRKIATNPSVFTVQDGSIGIVITEGQRIFWRSTLVFDLWNGGKILGNVVDFNNEWDISQIQIQKYGWKYGLILRSNFTQNLKFQKNNSSLIKRTSFYLLIDADVDVDLFWSKKKKANFCFWLSAVLSLIVNTFKIQLQKSKFWFHPPFGKKNPKEEIKSWKTDLVYLCKEINKISSWTNSLRIWILQKNKKTND